MEIGRKGCHSCHNATSSFVFYSLVQDMRRTSCWFTLEQFSWPRWYITRIFVANVVYAGDARQVPGFAVVYVVFGWAWDAIHGKCLVLLEILFWMTSDMNNLTCLYIVISTHQKWRIKICVLIFVATVFQTRCWSGKVSYQHMSNGWSYNLCHGHRGGDAQAIIKLTQAISI